MGLNSTAWIAIGVVGVVGAGLGVWMIATAVGRTSKIPLDLTGQTLFASGTAVMTRAIASTSGSWSLGTAGTLTVSAGDPVEFHGVSIGLDVDTPGLAGKHYLIVWTLIKDRAGNVFERKYLSDALVLQFMGKATRLRSSDPNYKLNPAFYDKVNASNKQALPPTVSTGYKTADILDPTVAASVTWWVKTSIAASKLYRSNMAARASAQIAISEFDPNYRG